MYVVISKETMEKVLNVLSDLPWRQVAEVLGQINNEARVVKDIPGVTDVAKDDNNVPTLVDDKKNPQTDSQE